MVDRWQLNLFGSQTSNFSGSVALSSIGLAVTPSSTDDKLDITQALEIPEGWKPGYVSSKTFCFVVKIAELGYIALTYPCYATTGNLRAASSDGSVVLEGYQNRVIIYVTQTTSTRTIMNAALYECYEDNWTAATCPRYTPKSRAVELAACQRYFYSTIQSDWMPNQITGQFDHNGCLDISIPIPTSMRKTKPTLTVYRYSSGSWNANEALLFTTSGGFETISGFSSYYTGNDWITIRYIDTAKVDKTCLLRFGFTASADL